MTTASNYKALVTEAGALLSSVSRVYLQTVSDSAASGIREKFLRIIRKAEARIERRKQKANIGNEHKFYVDRLLEAYAAGETENAQLGCQVNADTLASEITGKFRTVTIENTLYPLLQVCSNFSEDESQYEGSAKGRAKFGMSQDRVLLGLLREALNAFESGQEGSPDMIASDIQAKLSIALKLPKDFSKTKSQVKLLVQQRQYEDLIKQDGRLGVLIVKALTAAKERKKVLCLR